MAWLLLTLRDNTPIFVNLQLVSDVMAHRDGGSSICFPAGVHNHEGEVYNIVVIETPVDIMSKL